MTKVDTRVAASRWADTWARSWSDRLVQPIVELYAPDATCVVEPFTATYHGREAIENWLRQVFAEESDVRARFGVPLVDANRAAVRWWATLVEQGRPTTLAGTSVLRLNGEGLVTHQVDAWNSADATLELAAHWTWI